MMRTDGEEKTTPPRPQAQTSQRPVNYIEDHQRDSNSGSDTEYVFHTGKVKNLPYFDLSFGDGHQMFNVLAYSGATINILSEADYKSLRPTPLLQPTKTVISGFGVKEATPLLGQFSTLLKFRGISCQADIHVIKNPENPLLAGKHVKGSNYYQQTLIQSTTSVTLMHRPHSPLLNF